MKTEGIDTFSTPGGNLGSPKDKNVSGQDNASRPKGETCLDRICTSWSYLFVHRSKMNALEDQLAQDSRVYFIHKTVKYFKKKDSRSVQHKEVPTVSGLVFIQGSPKETQEYLDEKFPPYHLCRNCSTGRVAEIPDSQMRPFMIATEIGPDRVRFLLKPFHYYARNRVLLRITSGELAGLEGYVMRIDRDRRLVMDVGGISVAISGVHAERFEEVNGNGATMSNSEPFYKRNLQEREALIDRYFHPVKTPADVAAQAENIAYLRKYVLAELEQRRMDIHKVWRTFCFIIKEIDYYYSPLIDQFKDSLAPILSEGGKVLEELDNILATAPLSGDTLEAYQSEREKLTLDCGYLFCS